jgi:hypothetical protein
MRRPAGRRNPGSNRLPLRKLLPKQLPGLLSEGLIFVLQGAACF